MLSRLTALLSSQSFLLIAYATSMASAHGRWHEPFTLAIPPVLALLGIALAIEGRRGIKAAAAASCRWQERGDHVITEHPHLLHWPDISRSEASAARRAGEQFPLHAPGIFLVAWGWFACLPPALFLAHI
ncbi:hypothetical protein [Sphingomonas gellani]|nr:hypothetical protein [Sphingomonas gellani]